MKIFRLVIPILAGLLMAFSTLVAFARATPAPAAPPPPNASETDLLPSGDKDAEIDYRLPGELRTGLKAPLAVVRTLLLQGIGLLG